MPGIEKTGLKKLIELLNGATLVEVLLLMFALAGVGLALGVCTALRAAEWFWNEYIRNAW